MHHDVPTMIKSKKVNQVVDAGSAILDGGTINAQFGSKFERFSNLFIRLRVKSSNS